jgi:hypothetical protein
MPARTKKQQLAAKRALAAKRGKRNPKTLKGGALDMYERLSTEGLEDFSGSVAEGAIPDAPEDIQSLVDQFERSEVEMGMDVESEHDDGGELDTIGNELDILKTVLAHLKEDPQYYTHLTAMEKENGVKENDEDLEEGKAAKVFTHQDIAKAAEYGKHAAKRKIYGPVDDEKFMGLAEKGAEYGPGESNIMALYSAWMDENERERREQSSKEWEHALRTHRAQSIGENMLGMSFAINGAKNALAMTGSGHKKNWKLDQATREEIDTAKEIGASAYDRGVSKMESDKEFTKLYQKPRGWKESGSKRYFAMRMAWADGWNEARRGIKEGTTSTSSFEYDKSPTDTYKAPEMKPDHFAQEEMKIDEPDPQFADSKRPRLEGDEEKAKSKAQDLLWDEKDEDMGVDEVRQFLRPSMPINYGSKVWHISEVNEEWVYLTGRNGAKTSVALEDIRGISNGNTIVTELDEDRLGETIARMMRAMRHE